MSMDQIAAFLIGDNGIDLEDLENRMVRTAMAAAKQNVSKAARLLRLTCPALRCRLERLDTM
jgi:DNA-binding protein Fis